MTTFSFSAVRGGGRAAMRPGPATLAIRSVRPNEASSWEARPTQIDADERAALRDLRKRIAAQIEEDQNRIDRCLNALDLLDGDADFEGDAGDEPEGPDADCEPSLCGLSVEHGATDDREGPDDNGLGDAYGRNEQAVRFLGQGGDLRTVQAWF